MKKKQHRIIRVDTEEAERLFSLANVQGKGMIIFTNQGVICQKNNKSLQLGTKNM